MPHPTSNSTQSVPRSPTIPSRRPGFVAETKRFWQRVTEGLAMNQLMSQFKQDARTGFQLYRRDFDATAPAGQRRTDTWFQTIQEMVWAILGKLTPARRVLLLIAVVFLLMPSGDMRFHVGDRLVEFHAPGFQFWSGVLLFALLMLEVADRVVMKRDLEIARDIQSWLLPATPPIVPGLSVAFATRPANTVAGDFYDIFPRSVSNSSGEHFLMAVADVAGKSIPAALLMATFQASLKTLSSTPCSLLELVEGMNRYACCNSQGGLRFTTAFLAEFNVETRVLSYVNAGHNNPMLRRNTGEFERLDVGGLPLGIQPDATYASSNVVLAPGDWLAIFTDGLVEAQNQSAQEYGEEPLFSALNSGANSTPEIMLQRIIAGVNDFVGQTPQHDDITCMLIKAT